MTSPLHSISLRDSALAVPTLHVSSHPLVKAKLSLLRSKDRSPEVFRILVNQITTFLLYEALENLELASTEVQTPLAVCQGHQLANKVGFVPVLRAGMGMEHAALEFVPNAQVRHLGVQRDEREHTPVRYYSKLGNSSADVYYVLDPMLATGGSACDAIAEAKQFGKPVSFVGLIAAPEGVLKVHQTHPDVQMYLGVLDSHLDGNCYIVPGLGDAGDRFYNT